jgi:hypothetical protein
MGTIEAWNHCAPLSCSNIPRAPHEGYHEDLLDLIGLFHGNNKSALSHIISFIKVMNESYIIHEDVWMHTFHALWKTRQMIGFMMI